MIGYKDAGRGMNANQDEIAVESQEQFTQQSLTEHLRELRSCLMISLGAVAVGFVVAYSIVESLGGWFLQPLLKVLPKGKPLIFTAYQEGFFFI
ncbi:MAG: twin-arginine translocase subunit TatC [Desulfobulbus sp.]|nr:twin-arginine translocase subunit TatC [Desulfobulbus sp.]